MPAQSSSSPDWERALNDSMSTQKKELNDLADQKYFEYWANQEPKENKRLLKEYIDLVQAANAVKE